MPFLQPYYAWLKIIFAAMLALIPMVSGFLVLYADIKLAKMMTSFNRDSVEHIEDYLFQGDFMTEDEIKAHIDSLSIRIQAVREIAEETRVNCAVK